MRPRLATPRRSGYARAGAALDGSVHRGSPQLRQHRDQRFGRFPPWKRSPQRGHRKLARRKFMNPAKPIHPRPAIINGTVAAAPKTRKRAMPNEPTTGTYPSQANQYRRRSRR